MTARAVDRPGGKVSEVIKKPAELQGAYDLLEGGTVDVGALVRSHGEATAARAKGEAFVFAAIDGSSLTLVDRLKSKGFGSLGAVQYKGRGLKVINSMGISAAGVAIGLFDQQWWARAGALRQSPKAKRRRNLKRKTADKETRHWLDAIEQTAVRANKFGVRLWFQLDREADNREMLLKLAVSGHRFTVRSSWNRLVESTGQDRQYLRELLAEQHSWGQYDLKVPAGPNRTARRACMAVRVAQVVLLLRDKWMKTERKLALTAVWASEQGTTPSGEKPLDWLLFTNAEVATLEDAMFVVYGYSLRWCIEEFHKTWKSGACNAEDTQLRSAQAVMLWATMLAAVGIRIERLKKLSRTEPDLPASVELSASEIQAVILLKREIKKRTETISDSMPTIGQATLWIAELGGYTGKSSGGPPGSTTIRRGLEQVRTAAKIIEIIDHGGR